MMCGEVDQSVAMRSPYAGDAPLWIVPNKLWIVPNKALSLSLARSLAFSLSRSLSMHPFFSFLRLGAAHACV